MATPIDPPRPIDEAERRLRNAKRLLENARSFCPEGTEADNAICDALNELDAIDLDSVVEEVTSSSDTEEPPPCPTELCLSST
jgi:hypothetical protein